MNCILNNETFDPDKCSICSQGTQVCLQEYHKLLIECKAILEWCVHISVKIRCNDKVRELLKKLEESEDGV